MDVGDVRHTCVSLLHPLVHANILIGCVGISGSIGRVSTEMAVKGHDGRHASSATNDRYPGIRTLTPTTWPLLMHHGIVIMTYNEGEGGGPHRHLKVTTDTEEGTTYSTVRVK